MEKHGMVQQTKLFRLLTTHLPPQPRNGLMKVAHHPLLSNAAHVQHLPAAWGTLYELTKVPLPIIEQALEDGRIFADMERKDARAPLAT